MRTYSTLEPYLVTNSFFARSRYFYFATFSDTFLVHQNNFKGHLPNMKRMEFLTHLWCYDNNLSGEISSSTLELPNLESFSAQHNNFVGSIPSLINISKLSKSISSMTSDVLALSSSKF